MTAKTGVAGALERGREARRAWTQDSTLITPAAFGQARDCTLDELHALEARGELFSVVVEGRTWYLAELLKLKPEEAAAECKVLAGQGDATAVVMLMRRHGALGGKTVAEAVREGRLEEALARLEPRP